MASLTTVTLASDVIPCTNHFHLQLCNLKICKTSERVRVTISQESGPPFKSILSQPQATADVSSLTVTDDLCLIKQYEICVSL